MPRFVRQPPQRTVVSDTGVVHQKVNATQLGVGCLDKRLDLVALANVTAVAEYPHAVRPQRGLGEERLLENIPPGKLDVVERHMDAATGKFEADRPPEAGCTAGHHGHLAIHGLKLRRRFLRLLNQHRARRASPRGRTPRTRVRSVRDGNLVLLRALRT